ncbi:hypothetical protein [Sutcliffiella deserti]|uniref:hypothetical protein n=1 Tax=Sutcliffiella deserti TaxID=2875501 RepID=UPI001CBF7167|nr:hypothetical protein [Sutcliffiella deserti]
MKKSNSVLKLMLISLIILSGCIHEETNKRDHLVLNGESENWNLNGYEVEISAENFKAGNGILQMKNQNEYKSDFFQFRTYAAISNQDTLVHSGSVSGDSINIAEKSIGTIEGGAYLNEEGVQITLGDISEIYMIVEWWDTSEKENVKERIDLY